MAESIREISSEMGDNHGNFDLFKDQDVFEGEIFYYRRFDWKILRILNWIRVYAEKLVNALKTHKIVYAPMHTMQSLKMLAGLISPRLRVLVEWYPTNLDYHKRPC